jgi:hypothetical protein
LPGLYFVCPELTGNWFHYLIQAILAFYHTCPLRILSFFPQSTTSIGILLCANKFARHFKEQFFGFETDIHGLVKEVVNGKAGYYVDCVR